MQICDCEVRLGASAGHTVLKADVTPAEILILQAIHGQDAVVGIKPKKMDKRPNAHELDRLNTLYGRESGGIRDAGNGDLINKLFPGIHPTLPVSLKDIGMGHLMNPNRKDADDSKETDDGEGSDESIDQGEGGEDA